MASSYLQEAFEDPALAGFESIYGNGEMLLRPVIGGVEPWIAESITQSDPLTWVIQLKEGVTFQHGGPVDAAAVVDWLNWELEHDASVQTILPGITSVEATGPLEVTVKTKRPLATLPSFLADYRLPVYDVSIVKDIGKNFNDLAGMGVFTGPYEFTELTPQRLTYSRNEDYWLGRPALSEIVLVRVPDEQAAVRAIQAGESDILQFAPATLAPTLEGLEGVYFKPGTDNTRAIAAAVNYHRAPLDDASVRKALSLAIDYDSIAQNAMFDVFPVLHGLFPSDSPIAVDWQVYDLDEANRVLDEAGWVVGGDGIREKDGKRLAFDIAVYQDHTEAIATALQDMFKQAGIDTKIVRGDYTAWDRKINAGDFGMAFINAETIGFNGNYLLGMKSLFTPDAGPSNPAKIDDAAVNAIFAELEEVTDPEVIAQGIRDVQEINADQVYWIAFTEYGNPIVTNEEWKDFSFDGFFLPVDWETRAS